jgi:photosystem II stability/assembly factor-like uncharacterized protein
MLMLAASPIRGAGQSSIRPWEPLGLSGGGGMFSPAISPADPNLMMLNCDMSAAYISEDGGHHWQMIHHAQLRTDTQCRPGFHPSDANVIYASSSGRLKVSRDRGRTFTPIGDLKDSLSGEIAIFPSNPNLMLVGTRSGQCRISHDAGVTWAACKGPQGQVLGFHFLRVGRASRSPEDVVRGRTTYEEGMFAATSAGIWRSDDGGQTWSDATQGLPWKEIRGFAGGSDGMGLNMLYCTVTSKLEDGVLRGGVYRSRDRGQSWQSAMGRGINVDTTRADQWSYGPIAQYKQVLTTDARPRTVYVTNTSTGFHPPHHETVYRSDDGGDTWRATFFQDPRFKEYNVAPNYVTASAGQSYKGGDTPFGAALCNSDPNRLILVWSQSYVTHNGGTTWFNGDTYPANGKGDILLFPAARTPTADAEGKSRMSPFPKPGSAWACTGLVVTTTWNYYIDPFEANRHYIAYTDIGFARSLDSGRTWIWWDKNTWAPWRNTCYEIAFDPEVPGKMWGGFSNVHDIPNDNIISERHGHNGPGGVCVSRDFGASWKPEAQGLPLRPVTSIVLDPRSPKNARTLYAGVFMDGVYKSTDDGRTWTLKKTGLGHPLNMRVSRVSLHAHGTLFAMICAARPAQGRPLMSEGVGLYRSRDGAETWEKVNASQLFLYPKDFSVHPQDSATILVGVCDAGGGDQSGGLWRTTDAGRSWQRIGRQARQTFGGYFHPQQEGWVYMTLTEGAPGAGLWLSQDDGQTWQAFDTLPFSNIQRLTFDPAHTDRLYVTTFGGSIWRGPAVPQQD